MKTKDEILGLIKECKEIDEADIQNLSFVDAQTLLIDLIKGKYKRDDTKRIWYKEKDK